MNERERRVKKNNNKKQKTNFRFTACGRACIFIRRRIIWICVAAAATGGMRERREKIYNIFFFFDGSSQDCRLVPVTRFTLHKTRFVEKLKLK